MQDGSTRLALRKRELRAEQTALRDGLSVEQRDIWSVLVCRQAWTWLTGEGASALLAYAPFRSELDCRPLITEAWAEGYEVLLPRVIRGSGTLSLHSVRSWEDLAPGAYGIPEPITRSSDSADSGVCSIPGIPDAVFVPGLAFDLRGGRLGYGQGYYDRLRAEWEAALPGSAVRPLWVGLAYGVQVVPEVPLEEHDALMDLLITENGIRDCRKGRKPWS